jgi:hypothetical protein
LLQAACHLTSEEDSYGNEKGSQNKIKQQFTRRKLAVTFIAQQRFPQEQFEPWFAQQRKEEHTRLLRKKIQFPQIKLEEIDGPQVLALCWKECREGDARNERGQTEDGPQREEGNESQAGNRNWSFRSAPRRQEGSNQEVVALERSSPLAHSHLWNPGLRPILF